MGLIGYMGVGGTRPTSRPPHASVYSQRCAKRRGGRRGDAHCSSMQDAFLPHRPADSSPPTEHVTLRGIGTPGGRHVWRVRALCARIVVGFHSTFRLAFFHIPAHVFHILLGEPQRGGRAADHGRGPRRVRHVEEKFCAHSQPAWPEAEASTVDVAVADARAAAAARASATAHIRSSTKRTPSLRRTTSARRFCRAKNGTPSWRRCAQRFPPPSASRRASQPRVSCWMRCMTSTCHS